MPAEQKLYIHAGQTKTGSSFLQAAFAGSIDALKSMGILYPIDRKLAELARTGIPTSGNIDDGAPDLPQLIAGTFKSTRPNSCLLSNERIFDPLVRGDTLEKLRQGMPTAQIKVLFFVRDPLEHVISSYQQASKLRNDIGSFAEFAANYNRIGWNQAGIAKLKTFDIEVEVRNYSRHKTDLLPLTESWLGLAPGTLSPPETHAINRTLTRAETALQEAFVRHFGPFSTRYIGVPLAMKLPDVKPDLPLMSENEMQAFLSRMAIAIERNSDDIPADEAYSLPGLEEAMTRVDPVGQEGVYTLTQAQIDVLVASLSDALVPKSKVSKLFQPKK